MNQLLDAQGRPLTGAVEIPDDPRRLHVKLVIVPISLLANVVSAPPNMLLSVEGWPEDAKVVGAGFNPDPKGPQVLLTVYHPDFPVVVGQPEALVVRFNWEPRLSRQQRRAKERVNGRSVRPK